MLDGIYSEAHAVSRVGEAGPRLISLWSRLDGNSSNGDSDEAR